MSRPHILHFIVPVGLDGKTGGYTYDRQIVQGLRSGGWTVLVHALDDSFPEPAEQALADAAETLESLADGALVVIDGLAFGAMPELSATHGKRLRLVALVHHPLALETGLSEEQANQFRVSEASALAHAQSVIVTSAHTASALNDYAVPPERIRVVAPGCDPAPAAQGSTSDSLQMLCVATLTPRKGHAVLFEALGSLRDRAWQLTCAGSAERHPVTARVLQDLAQESGIGPRIRFTGEVDDAELARLYAGADLFVLASHHEGYGMVFDEALARGLPIVSTQAGATVDTVPRDAGVLVPAGNAPALAQVLAGLMDNTTQLQSLREGALRARDRLRSWPLAVDEFVRALALGQAPESGRTLETMINPERSKRT